MKKTFLYLSIAALLLSSCKTLDDLERYYDTHIILDEKAEMSVIPGVLVERDDDRIVLEFDRDIDEGILDLLRLTDYTETVPMVLPESLPGVGFYIDPEDEDNVIVDVSQLDRTSPRPVTLIYKNEKEPALAHMMLVRDSADGSAPGNGKSHSAVISDIHLNDARSMEKGWSWCNKNQEA